MSLVPVRKSDVSIGHPLPYSIYDARHKLLLREGNVVESMAQLEGLSVRGLFREQARRAAAGKGDSNRDKGEQAAPERSFQLDEIRLQIGDLLQLQSQNEAVQSRYLVRLVGYARGEAVLVTMPALDDKLVLVREGQSFVVRLFSGKSAYAFPASVIKATSVPFPHLHLTYPLSVRGLVVRRSARADVNIIAAVTNASGRSFAATIANISKQGALVVSRAPMGARGENLAVKFRVTVDDLDQYVTVTAVVRTLTPGVAGPGEEASVQHGVEFVEVPAQDNLALAAFVYQKLLEQAIEV
jgi:c-di-GMP-binding flagellar brake protein YcgR